VPELDPARLNRSWNCRITVTGRRSGEPRSTTIWFVAEDGRIFLTGGKENPQWCRNLRANGRIELRIGPQQLSGTARVVDDPEKAADIRDRFVRKYLLARLSRLFGGYTASVAVEVTLAPDSR
jgi:deazaflavin-dependent oxidoreductase (nitroreductase family)